MQICAVGAAAALVLRVCAAEKAPAGGEPQLRVRRGSVLSPLRALPPHASAGGPPPRPLIAVETALKEKIRIASPLI